MSVPGTSRAGPRPRHGGRRPERVVEPSERIHERHLDPQALGDHIDRLYRAARALCRSPEEAEDLVQETFARVLRRPRTLRADDDSGYLLQALRNTFVSTRRAASRRPQTTTRGQLEFIEDRHARKARSDCRGGGGIRRHFRPSRRLPRRDRRDRRGGPLVSRSRPRARGARGHDHVQALPCTSACGSRSGRRRRGNSAV